MDYPIEILPDPSKKFIDNQHVRHLYFLRITSSKDHEEIWDSERMTIKREFVCSPREHILDLSLILYGIFNLSHVSIELTDLGKSEYSQYCSPNCIVNPPTFKTHYIINSSKGCWAIEPNKIDGQQFPVYMVDSKDAQIFIGSLTHTPTKWNYWHFSFNLLDPDGDRVERGNKEKRKYTPTQIKNISNTIRDIFAEYGKARFNFNNNVIDSKVYINN